MDMYLRRFIVYGEEYARKHDEMRDYYIGKDR